VLVLNINPDASALETSFDPLASHELRIDTDGDLEADVAFHVLFGWSSDRGSAATVHRSTGAAARSRLPLTSRDDTRAKRLDAAPPVTSSEFAHEDVTRHPA